jgi:aspartate-semialdehyde dehydrogenase
MYKIAIAGASTLLGKELKDAIADSPLAAANLMLLDEEDAQGQLDQVGDEIAIVQSIEADSFDHVDFTFFCGTPELTLKHWRAALRAGSSVLDLSGALDQESGVLTGAPWLATGTASPDLFTPAIAPAHPAALSLALALDRLQSVAPIRSAAATVLLPASEFGQKAMDELHQQTINLLSFQSMPREIFDAQTAFNLILGLGESAKASLSAVEARIRRNVAALTGVKLPALALQVVQAPVFHGLTFSIAVELHQPAELAAIEDAFGGEHLDLVLEDTDSPSNLSATGQDDVLVRLRPELESEAKGMVRRLWLWAAADNLRLNAQNALACAMDLRRLRPQGSVQ